MTGREHQEKGRQYILRFLDWRWRFGFALGGTGIFGAVANQPAVSALLSGSTTTLADLISYRQDDNMVSAAVDFNGGFGAFQQHIWQGKFFYSIHVVSKIIFDLQLCVYSISLAC